MHGHSKPWPWHPPNCDGRIPRFPARNGRLFSGELEPKRRKSAKFALSKSGNRIKTPQSRQIRSRWSGPFVDLTREKGPSARSPRMRPTPGFTDLREQLDMARLGPIKFSPSLTVAIWQIAIVACVLLSACDSRGD